jgi:N6-adenosine-specific RNA methylase IME4
VAVRKFGGYSWRRGLPSGAARPLPYGEMTLEDIAALPVGDLAERDAHLYLWTTQRYLRASMDLVVGWGFAYSKLLVWCKRPTGFSVGGLFGNSCEFVVFATRGKPITGKRTNRDWWEWARSEHSAKPEAFIDTVEIVSPSPRLEMFARRNRLGWDTWGTKR